MAKPNKVLDKNQKHTDRKNYSFLFIGSLAIIIGMVLLLDIALGILLIFGGSLLVNKYMKNR